LADNRLSLIVSFTGNDKLSGAIRNLIGLGAVATGRSRYVRSGPHPQKEMADLNQQIAKARAIPKT
jgi:hypothetical protein